MKFIDVFVENDALAGKARELGFAAAFAPAVVNVAKPGVPGKKSPCLVIARGEDGELLRQIARSRDVDAVDPSRVPKYWRDDGLVRAVAEAGKAFVLPLAPLLLRQSFALRARNLSQVGAFVKKCVKLRAPFILASGAASAFDVKSPREWIAVGQLLGLSREQVQYSLSSEAARVVERAGLTA